jgi:hypothetical protein
LRTFVTGARLVPGGGKPGHDVQHADAVLLPDHPAVALGEEVGRGQPLRLWHDQGRVNAEPDRDLRLFGAGKPT